MAWIRHEIRSEPERHASVLTSRQVDPARRRAKLSENSSIAATQTADDRANTMKRNELENCWKLKSVCKIEDWRIDPDASVSARQYARRL